MSIGDIEFLAVPHTSPDLFGGDLQVHVEEVRAAMHHIGTWVQGGPRAMRITDVLGREGTRLELYLVHPPAAWGSMLAIRTGPEELGRYCVSRMRGRGFRHIRGHVERLEQHLWKTVPTDTEEEFFAIAGVQCLPPKMRDEQAAGLWRALSEGRRRA